ncbi:hypothetical protein BJX99DRAFT_220455, partial [Aspergillus californicus]
MIWHFCGLFLAPWLLLGPVQIILPNLWYEPGDVAAKDRIQSNWFEYRGVAEVGTDTDIAAQPQPRAGRRTLARMRYAGDAYFFTAIALGAGCSLAAGHVGAQVWGRRI